MFAMPTLLVNSVIKPTKRQTTSKIITGGKYFSGIMDSPILLAKQEATLPLDIANPPPNRNIKLQGIFFSITSHVIKPSEGKRGLFSAVDQNEFVKSHDVEGDLMYLRSLLKL